MKATDTLHFPPAILPPSFLLCVWRISETTQKTKSYSGLMETSHWQPETNTQPHTFQERQINTLPHSGSAISINTFPSFSNSYLVVGQFFFLAPSVISDENNWISQCLESTGDTTITTYFMFLSTFALFMEVKGLVAPSASPKPGGIKASPASCTSFHNHHFLFRKKFSLHFLLTKKLKESKEDYFILLVNILTYYSCYREAQVCGSSPLAALQLAQETHSQGRQDEELFSNQLLILSAKQLSTLNGVLHFGSWGSCSLGLAAVQPPALGLVGHTNRSGQADNWSLESTNQWQSPPWWRRLLMDDQIIDYPYYKW